MRKIYWVSCPAMTFRVVVRCPEETIIDAAPVVRKFIGQRFTALRVWLRRFGDVEVQELV